MKEGRRAGGITAGPESKVLEGLTWEEARNLQVIKNSCFSTYLHHFSLKVSP